MSESQPDSCLERQLGGFAWPHGTRRLGHPWYWFKRSGHQLWFVNSSPETLAKVVSDSVGFFLVDGEELHCTSAAPERVYLNVQSGEGVWVDEFDDFWDPDFLIQTRVQVTTGAGETNTYSSCGKGGSSNARLLNDPNHVVPDW